jgi:hypothetical protein
LAISSSDILLEGAALLAQIRGNFGAAVSPLQQKDSHPDKDDDDDGDRIFDQPSEPDPRSTMPLKFGIDRRHTLPRLLKNQNQL